MAVSRDKSPADGGSPNGLSGGERVLRWSVYIMGVLIIVGMIVIAVTIVKRASELPHRTTSFKPFDVPVGGAGEVTRLALDGNRLAVHVRTKQGDQIIILDVRKGIEIGRIRLGVER